MNAVSVVIPTLGGEQLSSTLASLNSGTLIPEIIYVCIPEKMEILADIQGINNIQVCRTQEKGQVQQRAFGLVISNTDFVLQLDDDIQLEKNCLEQLVQAANRLGKMTAVSPSFINSFTLESLYRVDKISFAKKCYFFLLNGRKGHQSGSITLAGTTLGIDLLDGDQAEMESEWLPGGCVLHHRINIISKNYYPSKGKAYSEDLYFSQLARERGLKLYISRDSKCFVEPSPNIEKLNFQEFCMSISDDLKARKKFVIDTGRSRVRMYLFYLTQVAVYLTLKLIDNWKS